MTDPDNLLLGAHLNLRKVRFVTYEPGDPIPEPALVEYTREAARLATMSRYEGWDLGVDGLPPAHSV